MGKKFGKFLLFVSTIGAAFAGAYYFMKTKSPLPQKKMTMKIWTMILKMWRTASVLMCLYMQTVKIPESRKTPAPKWKSF